ncbi:LytTR family DNA-binding domain-containing protein [Ancylomarina sp. 16SWW S1-10-2]|uniref:LytR/AlgR family response regulator transcription factor n=1 Tax=Ancylomarina sp. 16SWW S1-10-2 TaxID=2499681 RepID=UPI00189E2A66|nr:LytTR family DNA-binding domain-containing protein [Ancylomarina sp. 16SWW S1-10-2]
MIKTIIVDDEMKSQSSLFKLLERFCPDVEVIGFACNVKTAVELINQENPELVFLDISMPDGNGFDVLEQVNSRNFEVIFTTAYNEYALKAIQFSALHYLLKPINYTELKEAVFRFQDSKKDVTLDEKFKVLYDSLKNEYKKIILPTANGLRMVELSDIVRCEANGSYTDFFLDKKEDLMVSKPLSNFMDILPEHLFCRVHNKHLVNLNFVEQYIKGRGGRIILKDGKEIEVSEGKKKDFIESLKKFAHSLPDKK